MYRVWNWLDRIKVEIGWRLHLKRRPRHYRMTTSRIKIGTRGWT